MAPLLARKPGVDHAFERIYRRHAGDVYRYAFAVLRNQADAEDVTQTTFMNAYRALERGEQPKTPHNWLIAIAHNVCRQRFRQASRRPLEVGLEDDVADHFVEPEDDNAPSPEDIRRALQHLAFNQRAALVMRELEGRSYAEIADLLELSVSAVETLIFRARRALREQLEGALTCGQAEQAISRELDRALSRAERSQLRAHLRECAPCRKIARSQRAQRSALKALGAVPLPSSLASLFGGGASVGTVVAAKAAVVVVAAGVATGVGIDVHHRMSEPPAKHHRTVPAHTVTQQQAAPRPLAPPDAPVAAVVVSRAQPPRRAAHVTTRSHHVNKPAHAAVVAPQLTTPAPPAEPAAQTPTLPAAATNHGGRGAAANAHGQGGTHGKSAESPGHLKKNQSQTDATQTTPAPVPPQPSPGNGHGNGKGNGHSGEPGNGNPGQGQGQGKGHGGETTVPLPPADPVVPTVTTPTLPVVTLPDGDG
jgi:RNA polymerase sigma-70 factor (ECF subfamily)